MCKVLIIIIIIIIIIIAAQRQCNDQCFSVTVRAGTTYWHLCHAVGKFCLKNPT